MFFNKKYPSSLNNKFFQTSTTFFKQCQKSRAVNSSSLLLVQHNLKQYMNLTTQIGGTKGLAKVHVHANSDESMRCDVFGTRKKQITLDEPKEIGGTDAGLTPMEAMLGSLAGCESAAARIVAKQMGIKIGKMKFDVQGLWDNSPFLDKNKDVPTHFQNIHMTVDVETEANVNTETFTNFSDRVEKLCPICSLLRTSASELKVSWNQHQTNQ